LIHRDVARLSAFGFGDDQPITSEVNLPPLKIQNFAPSHSSVESQNDDGAQIRPSAEEHTYQPGFFLNRQVSLPAIVELELPDALAGIGSRRFYTARCSEAREMGFLRLSRSEAADIRFGGIIISFIKIAGVPTYASSGQARVRLRE